MASSLDSVSDHTYLKYAVKQAKRYGLLWEFRDAYRTYRSEGDTIKTAAWCALYDWDMLDIVGEASLGLRIPESQQTR